MTKALRVTSRNARFQQWEALLTNRNKRQRSGEFMVQGVRPISLAIEHRWPIHALLYDADAALSRWARDVVGRVEAPRFSVATELIRELGGKSDAAPEVLAVVGMRPDDLSRVPVGPDFLGTVFDRPSSPGNIGSLIRTLDAFGASGLVVAGHAADPYDPRAVRGSTGSLFAVPVVRQPSQHDIVDWLHAIRAGGVAVELVGTDEKGGVDIFDHDLTKPTLLVVGNETSGLSKGWREACDSMVRIPISGSASSLNAANAAAIVLYEAVRQRKASTR